VNLTIGIRSSSHVTLARKEADQNFEKLDIGIVDPPGKCQTDFGWEAWHIASFTRNKLLSATMGAAKLLLAYVIRNDIVVGD
jgi:hypothetical protein